jgi:hypothetical protein
MGDIVVKSLSVFLLSLIICCTACNPTKIAINTSHRIEITEGYGTKICSATAVGKHTLLTATHCDSENNVVIIDGESTIIIEKVFDHYDHELMIVKTEFKHFARFSNEKARIGQHVWICGNPKGLPNIVREGTFAGSISETDPAPGILNGVYDIYLYDLNSTNGDSGSAIFNSFGEIVDVDSISYVYNSFHLAGAFALHFNKNDLSKIK